MYNNLLWRKTGLNDIKKHVVAFMTSVLFMALSSNVAFAAESKVPSLMQPNSIIIYDDDRNPSVVSGGYVTTTKSSAENRILNFNIDDYMRKIPTDATEEERESIEEENHVIRKALEDVKNGTQIIQNDIEIIPGMKVIYDENGELFNIYYVDDFCPEGYTLHGNAGHMESDHKGASDKQARATTVTWGDDYVNTLVYQPKDNSILGTGRATYYDGLNGNRDNPLKDGDVATQMDYDYSRTGDQPVAIRNLDTDEAFTYYQADVGSLPDAVIDIWGLNNLEELAGKEGVRSVPNVRYYHKLFSDQDIPNW